MARANKRKWVNLVAGLLVGTAAQPLALFAGPDIGLSSLQLHADREELVVAQFSGGPSRAHVALNGAIDAQRLGDLDTAAALFREAQARQNDLTPDERRDLDRLLAANALALQARRDAREQLGQAETALLQGRAADAAVLIKRITANELYLSAADKQRFRALCQKLHVQPAASAGVPTGNPTAQAHAKLQAARAELSKTNLNAAEALTREAEQLHGNFGPNEDSPRRMLEDLDKARKDPRTMLLAARAALQRGELDHAEQFAHTAEQIGSTFTFPVWGDTPGKALKDIQTARAAAGSQKAAAPATAASVPSEQAVHTEKARALILQGRKALAAGDTAQARKCAEQAAALKADLHWVEDNPAKLLDDIARADTKAGPVPGAPSPTASVRTKEDGLALLQKGREQLAHGELEEANKTAARLHAAKHLHWGLFFEDTPDKLQANVDHARAQRSKEKSVELMAEARRRFEKKDYDGAEKLAYEAQKLHGSYSIWDLGDRPSKLLANVQSQRLKERRVKLPDPPVMAKGEADLSHGPLAQLDKKPDTPPSPNVAQARLLLADARTALRTGDTAKARALADQVRDMHIAWNNPGDDTPENIYREIDRLSPARPPVAAMSPAALLANKPSAPPAATVAEKPPHPTPVPLPGSDVRSAHARAWQLMADARMMQRQNRLIEARDKIVEAQKLGVAFRPDEETPDQIYQQIAFLARQRIDSLLTHANETVRFGTQAPAVRRQAAEKDLAQARQLAVAFGQDTQPIERTLLLAQQLNGMGGVTLVATPPATGGMLPPASIEKGGPSAVPAPASPQARGMKLLDDARLELRAGQTATARRLAEEACNYGVRDQALAVLRSIDTEEFNQRCLQANHAFSAVVAAYNRHEYHQAGLLLAAIDIKLLDGPRQSRLREILSTPEMQPAARGMAIALTSGQATEPGDKTAGPAFNPQLNQAPNAASVGKARATDAPDQSLLARTRALREVKFQQLRQKSMDVQTQALDRFRSGQTDAAVDMLQDYLVELSQEQLDAGQLTLLRRPIESRVQQFRLMKAQVDFANQSTASLKQSKNERLKFQNAEQVKQKNVAELMKQYNELFKTGKYSEAEALALRVKELDPDNPMATAAITIARTQRRKDEYETNKENKEKLFLDAMNETDRQGDSKAIKSGITFEEDRERLAIIRGRKNLNDLTLPMPRKTAEEREIERKLNSPVNLNFTNAPLRQVIDDLRAFKAVNIYVDDSALGEKGISQDMPVSIKLENISLKSALNLLLHSVHLTYFVKDDVLQITTEDQARGKLEPKVYQVTDLVLAVENFGQVGQTAPSQLGIENVNQPVTGAPSPVTGPYSLNGGQPVGAPMGGSLSHGGGAFASDPTNSGQPQITKQRSQTNEEMLIKLITNTIAPRSWGEQGGPGTIEYFPLTMSLVINQTPDIQDQVADLLAALRRLQDQEVAVEVKFISIAEDFFERIGVNFNLNIVNKNSTKYQPQSDFRRFPTGRLHQPVRAE